MKLIDEKGRIFGKVNIIDALVVLFVIGLIPIFIWGYRLLNEIPTKAFEPEYKYEELKAELYPYFYEHKRQRHWFKIVNSWYEENTEKQNGK